MPIGTMTFPMLSPQEAMPGLTGANYFNQALQTALQTAYAPAMAQAEIQQKTMGSLPDLDKAYMFYTNTSQRLGEEHPDTKAALSNYNALLDQAKTLSAWHTMQTANAPFAALPSDIKQAVATSLLSSGQTLPSPAAASSQQLPQTPMQYQNLKTMFPQGGTPITQQQLPALAQGVQAASRLPIAQPSATTLPTQDNLSKSQLQYAQQFLPGQKAYSTAAGKSLNDTLDSYNTEAQGANTGLNALEELNDAYRQIPDYGKGPIFGKISKYTTAGQETMKNAARMIMQMIPTMKGISRITNVQLQMLSEGNPNALLTPEAENRIYDELKLGFKGQQGQASLAQSLRQYTDDPNTLKYIVNKAQNEYPIVDEKGNLHPENIPMWSKYASKDALSKGDEFLPEDISGTGESISEFRKASLMSGIPISEIIKRYKQAKGIK